MATFYLLNTTIIGQKKNFPGDLLNDAIHDTTAIQQAGGVLWPSADATVAAAATKCQAARKAKGSDEFALQAIMFAAAASSSRNYTFNVDRGPAGANIADADGAIVVGEGSWRVVPTLSGNRTITINTTGAVAGDQITITRTSTAANTLAIANGGPGAGTLTTFPVSKNGYAKVQFDGTNWALREVGVGS